MNIKDYSNLLAKALTGEHSAIYAWCKYASRSLDQNEAFTTLTQINAILKTDDHPQRSHALAIHGFTCLFTDDTERAIHFFDEAIILNNVAAMTCRALMYLNDGNYSQATLLLDKAIELGDPEAMNIRAMMYLTDQGNTINYEAALSLLKTAIKSGHPDAVANHAYAEELQRADALHNAPKKDEHTPLVSEASINPAISVKLPLEEEAEKPSTLISSFNTDDKPENTRPSDDNLSQMKSDDYFQLVAKALEGESTALGQWCEFVVNSEDFTQEKMTQTMQAIEPILSQHNHKQRSHALTLQGFIYLFNRDDDKAIPLFEEAIAMKNPAAMTVRALMHNCSQSGELDYTKSIHLLDKAITLNHTEAMSLRAEMHIKGYGGPRNYPAAIHLIEKANALGDNSNSVDEIKKLLERRIERLKIFKSKPSIAELFNTIEAMKVYGNQLAAQSNDKKAAIVIPLANTLQLTLEDFLLNPAIRTEKSIQEFKAEFSKLIYDKDNYAVMQTHREIWKPIVANILLALTGIGLLALLTKIAVEAIQPGKRGGSFLNRALFFAETNSEKQLNTIEEASAGARLY